MGRSRQVLTSPTPVGLAADQDTAESSTTHEFIACRCGSTADQGKKSTNRRRRSKQRNRSRPPFPRRRPVPSYRATLIIPRRLGSCLERNLVLVLSAAVLCETVLSETVLVLDRSRNHDHGRWRWIAASGSSPRRGAQVCFRVGVRVPGCALSTSTIFNSKRRFCPLRARAIGAPSFDASSPGSADCAG